MKISKKISSFLIFVSATILPLTILNYGYAEGKIVINNHIDVHSTESNPRELRESAAKNAADEDSLKNSVAEGMTHVEIQITEAEERQNPSPINGASNSREHKGENVPETVSTTEGGDSNLTKSLKSPENSRNNDDFYLSIFNLDR